MIQESAHKEITALIRLMEDPDPSIFSNVYDRLKGFGLPLLPMLEEEWSRGAMSSSHQERIERLIREIRLVEIKKDLFKWRESSNRDLLTGVLILNRFQHPDIDAAEIEQEMEKIARQVWLEISDDNTAFETVKIINHVLFEEWGFSVSNDDFHAPRYSYLNTLLKSRQGNQLSLSILYSIIAQKLSIPIYGVNFHKHFALGFIDDRQTLKFLGLKTGGDDRDVLFYINPEKKGKIFDHFEIENYLKALNLPMEKSYFEPCSNSDIIRKLLQNLVASYVQVGEEKKALDLQDLQSVLW